MLPKHRLLSALTAFVTLAAPITAYAGVGLEAVWYPDGYIRWYNKNVDNAQSSGEPTGENIREAMDYLATHTPLDIAEAPSEASANLFFVKDNVLPSGGMCAFYWDENRFTVDKKIGFSPNNIISFGTVLHEMGHALGFPHEFQRADRDSYVDVCFNVDPFNYGKMGSAYWPDAYNHLSPYDFGSVMHAGYFGCVDELFTPTEDTDDYRGETNQLSRHDINNIYRVYADTPGLNENGDRFGHEVAAGDFDDDGYDDIAAVKTDRVGTTTYVILELYRGVATDGAESGAGVRYVPWFTHTIGSTSLLQPNTALAAGDFNGDGITDLAVGQPWYNSHRGRVQLLFLNTGPDDTTKPYPDRAPWGHRGVEATITILPTAVGIGSTVAGRFGASLSAARLTSKSAVYHYDDLIIGAPQATSLSPSISGGAVAIVQGRQEPTASSFTIGSTVLLWNPGGGSDDDFGVAVSAMPRYCKNQTDGSVWNDTVLVGSPGRGSDAGAVYLYGCATSSIHTTENLSSPSLVNTHVHAQAGARHGAAVAGLRRRSSDSTYDYTYFAAVGAPSYTGSTPNPKSGIVYLYQYDRATNTRSTLTSFRPSTRSDNDEFGHSIAVQQVRLFDDDADPRMETYLGIGMPGTQVNGIVAGKVYVWRPWSSDGTINSTAHVINAESPSSTTDTRFGASIAALRNLHPKGGFVAGAPNNLRPDGTTAGSARVILDNSASSYAWSTWATTIDQESEGDFRPTN